MRIQVVVALIQDAKRGVLISRRQSGQHLAGLWEFPGGKVDQGEAADAALSRELKEELGVSVASSRYLFNIEHDYAEKSVELLIYNVVLSEACACKFDSEHALGEEGQIVRWVATKSLINYSFPAANASIVEALLKA